MASKLSKTLANRFYQIAKLRSAVGAAADLTCGHVSLRRCLPFIQKRPIFQTALPPDRISMPVGDRLVQQILGLNPTRLNLDGLVPPRPPQELDMELKGVTAEAVRKVMRAVQKEKAMEKLRGLEKNCVPHSEFLRICCEASDAAQGPAIAKSFEESGAVIVFGDVVFIRTEEIVKAVLNVIPLSLSQPNDTRREELSKMEETKAEIDRRAVAQVRRELWCGLGFLVVQTAAFMRLTFWELSWDVMEPICFYVTSMYFMAGYAFFLRTSKEPSFEGFFASRFAAKQKRLMKAKSFDINRFNELRQACDHPSAPSLRPSACPHHEFTSLSYCDSKGPLIGSLH